MRTPFGYYQNMNPADRIKVGHTEEEFIAECSVTAYDGYSTLQKSCKEYANITQLSVPSYFNCYTISADIFQDSKLKSNKDFLIGYSLVLYLDNFGEEDNMYLDGDENTSGMGAVVLPHAPTTEPWLHKLPVHLPPGAKVNRWMGMNEKDMF